MQEQLSLYNTLTRSIIGCAMEVHSHLGPGLLESAYHECLCYELAASGLKFESQSEQPIQYKGHIKNRAYFADIIVEKSVVLELKAVEEIHELHVSQILTYMKLGDYKVGLLLNFNVKSMRQGIKRFVNKY